MHLRMLILFLKQVADLRWVDATAPSLHLMDGESLQGFLHAWVAKSDPSAGGSSIPSASTRGISSRLPLVVSVVVRVQGGRASAAALKTLSMSYDAGDGLFATLTQQSRPTSHTTSSSSAADAQMRTKFCIIAVACFHYPCDSGSWHNAPQAGGSCSTAQYCQSKC